MKILLSQLDLPTKDLRTTIDEDALDELADSMREHGQLQPIGVRKTDAGRYEVVFGARRTRAARLLRWTEIEASLTELPDEHNTASKKLIENVQRQDLTPIEEAYGLLELVETDPPNVRELMRQTGKSRSWVISRLELADLPDDLQKAVQAGLISSSVAIVFGSIQNEAVRNDFVGWAIDHGCTQAQAKAWIANAPAMDEALSSVQEYLEEQTANSHEAAFVKPRYNCFGCRHPFDFNEINQMILCGGCQQYLVRRPAAASQDIVANGNG